MMEAADAGEGDHLGARGQGFRSTSRGRVLPETAVRPIIVVVRDVLAEQTPQVNLVQHDHVVEQFPAATADPAFSDTVLPRASEAGSLGMDAGALHCVDHFFVELLAMIEDHVPKTICRKQRISAEGAFDSKQRTAAEEQDFRGADHGEGNTIKEPERTGFSVGAAYDRFCMEACRVDAHVICLI
jgi:hypothetical protein